MNTSAYYGFWQYWNLYHKVTFDGPNRIIIINPGESTIDVSIDLYSDWKEWMMLEDYSKYPQALSTIGGEPIGGGQYIGATYFLENGWRIRPPEQDSFITFDGNLFTRESGESPVIATIGRWNTVITSNRSAIVFKVETESASTGSTAPTAAEIAQAVWNYNSSQSFAVNTFGNHVSTRLLTIAQYLGIR